MNINNISLKVKHFDYDMGKRRRGKFIPVKTFYSVAIYDASVPEEIVDEAIYSVSHGLDLGSKYKEDNIVFCTEEQYQNVFSSLIRAIETAYWFKDIKQLP